MGNWILWKAKIGEIEFYGKWKLGEIESYENQKFTKVEFYKKLKYWNPVKKIRKNWIL